MIRKENEQNRQQDSPVDAAQTAGFADIAMTEMGDRPARGCRAQMPLWPDGNRILCVNEHIKLRPVYRGGTGSISESLEQPDFMPTCSRPEPSMLQEGRATGRSVTSGKMGIEKLREKAAKKQAKHDRCSDACSTVKRGRNIKVMDSQEITHLQQ